MNRPQLFVAAFALLLFEPSAPILAEDRPPVPIGLLEKQLDVSLEARDVERVLGKVKQASDLAKQRIGEAAASAESTVKSIERRDASAARERAAATSRMLEDVAAQLEVMLKDDLPQQIEATQRLIEELAELERELGMMLGEGSGGKADEASLEKGSGTNREKKPAKDRDARMGAGKSEEERNKELVSRAERLAAKAGTIEDVLKSLSSSADAADREAIQSVEQVITETKLADALQAIRQGASSIQTGRKDEARVSALDAADRLEIAAQRLGQAYRKMIAPRAEELRQLESQLAGLQERMNELETPSQLKAWQSETSELLDELEQMGFGEMNLAELNRLMAAGTDSKASPDSWGLVNGHYVVPAKLARVLREQQSSLQNRLQTLLLGDFRSDADGAIPAKYVELVDRYYDVLSRESAAPKESRP